MNFVNLYKQLGIGTWPEQFEANTSPMGYEEHWPKAMAAAAREELDKIPRLLQLPFGVKDPEAIDNALQMSDMYRKMAARKLREITKGARKGMASFVPKIPVGNALNALDFAPIPEGLIQQMIDKLQPPQT